MLGWCFGVLIGPFFNKRKQRIGDMVAGTIVVKTPKAQFLSDLSQKRTVKDARFTFDPAQLSILGRDERQALKEILRTRPTSPAARKQVSKASQTIGRKIGFRDKIPPNLEWGFLQEFSRQREFLESRHLFGDSREDKHHAKSNRRKP